MSEEKEYVELTLRLPGDKFEADLRKVGEKLCEIFADSRYSEDFVNNDIIVNYDTPNEFYLALSMDFVSNPDNDSTEVMDAIFYAFSNPE